jgi:beta-lactamase regulating signal transducer with metallopeptidase domain
VSVELAVRAAALLALGTALAWSLRQTSAAARHLLWHVTVVASLALPLTTLVSPSWSLSNAPGRPASAGAGWSAAPERGFDPSRAALDRATDVWLAGSATVALYFLTGYARLWMVRRRGRPAPPVWSAAVVRLGARARISREVGVLVAPGVASPLVTGLWRPAVLIPPEAATWTAARREAVLVHELAHIRRRDLASQFTAQALTALHWFNPLAWHAAKQMRRERELACDAEVLRAGVAPVAYASELLAIAIAAQPLPAAALSMVRPSELEGRLAAVLAAQPRRRSRIAGALLALVVMGASVTIAGAQLTSTATAVKSTGLARWTILPAGEGREVPRNDPDEPPSGDSRARERAALLLGITGGSEAVPALLQALADPDASVREKAAVGLAWRRDDRVGPALVAAAGDPSPSVREKVLVALAFSGEPRAAALIDAARSDPDAAVRDKAHKLQVLR